MSQAFPEALRILCPHSGKVRFMLLEYDRVIFRGMVWYLQSESRDVVTNATCALGLLMLL